MTTPVVVGEHVTKSYGHGDARVVALDDVSLEVRPGELLLVRGPSGSGKTTLLHCLSGIARPDAGRVSLDGVDLAELSDDVRSDLRGRAMSFVFQRFNLLPALTVTENVNLPLLLLGLDRDEVTRRTEEALRTVGLEGRGGAFPDQLSGGQLQLAAVARAVASDPRVIWADEPTGSLDTEAADRVLRTLRGIVERGATLVLVSHDPAVEPFADRVVMLRDGRLAT